MQKTNIEYLDYSWNPIAMRCSRVSEGCQNCWHLQLCDMRKTNQLLTIKRREAYAGGKYELIQKELEAPLRRKKPSTIGVQFMGDLFHPSVPFEWIDRVVEIFDKCPQHTGQLLTKRSKRMLEYAKYRNYKWPDNIIGMVTAENQKCADERIPDLLQCGFKTTGISCEPLLEDIKYNMSGIRGSLMSDTPDWVIVGCESGTGRRPCKLEWVRNIRDQCKTANVPLFIKQLNINGKVEHDINKFPEDLRIREMPR